MTVLVDSSVWIDYFQGSEKVDMLDLLIEENLLAINDLILAELVPYLRIKRQRKLLLLLQEIRRIPLKIDWEEIVEMQIKCIRTGINKVGIPDLLIAQNAIQNKLVLYSLDKHFSLMAECTPLSVSGEIQ
jgi:predicted nucleic acid-binding protein